MSKKQNCPYPHTHKIVRFPNTISSDMCLKSTHFVWISDTFSAGSNLLYNIKQSRLVLKTEFEIVLFSDKSTYYPDFIHTAYAMPFLNRLIDGDCSNQNHNHIHNQNHKIASMSILGNYFLV